VCCCGIPAFCAPVFLNRRARFQTSVFNGLFPGLSALVGCGPTPRSGDASDPPVTQVKQVLSGKLSSERLIDDHSGHVWTSPTIERHKGHAIGALIWGYLYSPNLSPFNQVLNALHQSTIDFLSPAFVLFSIANIVTWTWTGYNMITLFAALQNIPQGLYEAARVDGATTWDIVRNIKLPLLMPRLKLLFIFSVIGTSQLFTEAFVLRPLGYVADNITPNLYLYLTAARDANYSYAGAMAILLALLIFALSGPFLRRIGSR